MRRTNIGFWYEIFTYESVLRFIDKWSSLESKSAGLERIFRGIEGIFDERYPSSSKTENVCQLGIIRDKRSLPNTIEPEKPSMIISAFCTSEI